MFSNFFKRLFGGAAGNEAATSTVAPQADEPSAASVAAAPAPAADAPLPVLNDAATTEAQLRRSLHWRSKVLMEGASREAQQSDGPALVEELTHAGEGVIRQP
ncbi:MAG: hypothetical protein IT348_15455, partial [Candidatus Eisenbacteria bacterium]|nr:hypothetical protein [Candidatus Eisenbacteria bacterium]